MIIDGRDCAFKALYRTLPYHPWEFCIGHFFTQKDVMTWIESQKAMGFEQFEMIWPVSVIDGDIVEVPNQEELQ